MRHPIRLVLRAFWSLLGFLFNRRDRLQRLVDTMGIVVFVGPNGSGKSLAGVDSLLPSLDGIEWECDDPDHEHTKAGERAGVRLVYSTLPLTTLDGESHPLYRPLTDYRQLVGIEHAEVFLDEVAGVSDAADSASTPAALTRWLQQLRKRDVRLRVTTPAYERCSKPIRQVAQLVVDCRSFFPVESESGRLWRPRQAMTFEAFDAFEFNTFDKASGARLQLKARRFFWRPGCKAERSYNTLAQVSALAEVTESGMCMACGGSRPRPRCGCAPEVDNLIGSGQLEVIETVSSAGARLRKAVVKTPDLMERPVRVPPPPPRHADAETLPVTVLGR